jgi:predicted RNase H-like nuclease
MPLPIRYARLVLWDQSTCVVPEGRWKKSLSTTCVVRTTAIRESHVDPTGFLARRQHCERASARARYIQVARIAVDQMIIPLPNPTIVINPTRSRQPDRGKKAALRRRLNIIVRRRWA